MHMIAYISDYIPGERGITQDLVNIETTAKSNNIKFAIKGVLFFQDGQFLQVIEGVESDLRDLMSNIEKDKRHENIEYLIDTPVVSLSFQDWNMDSFHLGAGKVFDRTVLKQLTKRFTEKLLPQSKVLVAFYKGVLDEQAHAV